MGEVCTQYLNQINFNCQIEHDENEDVQNNYQYLVHVTIITV